MSTENTRAQFRSREELLDFMLEVSAGTSETLDLDALMGSVADIVRRVIPYDLFAILLWSEKRQALRIRYARGHRQEIIDNLELALGEGITGAAAAARQPVMLGDVRTDSRYLNALDAVRSELAVPMVVRQKLVGVLDLQSTELGAFSAQDQALLKLIASRVGNAVANARLHRRVEKQTRLERALAHMAREFSSILSLDTLLARVAKSLRSQIHYDSFSILLVDEARGVLHDRYSLRYDRRERMGDDLPLNVGLTGAAATARVPVLARDTANDPRYVPWHPEIRSELAVPLILKDRVIGVLDLESDRVGYFNEEHARMLGLVAPSIASAIENARLYEEVAERERKLESDLDAARQLQALLMPARAPEGTGLEIGHGWRAARAVSGDLYDFFEHDEQHLLLAFGDSSGKGPAAALYGSLISGLLRSMAPGRRSPKKLLAALNATLAERKVPARYITLLVSLWESATRTFTIANGGSPPPLVVRAGKILQVQATGVPPGMLDEVEYEEKVFQAQPGDVVVLYSDGIQDQHSPEKEEYQKARFPALLAQSAALPAQEIVDRILADIDDFRGTNAVFDDQSLVVMKVL